ncbi:hypothetical protein SAMN02745194_02318 [Roseomonas rosea]|uniref:Allophanate hydrolase C-terminal domain-containing protein n=1 Tax=Muricoccus roseus TaxID=198092 RepID=A0A1M6IGX3_9PROT|nr:hypothetical protein [Roseomonas rosea]SHJ33693.1 hypothetical protein SAMN02745194_02318 [Roseomonas rosea]
MGITFPRPTEAPDIPEGHVGLVVNGGLMRGMRAHGRMIAAGALFLRDVTTAPLYRLWSIGDRHPGMIRVAQGSAIAAELYAIPRTTFPQVVEEEAPGLCVGRVPLSDGTAPLGVLIEPWRVEGMEEITAYGGWRAFVEAKGIPQS